MSRRVVGSDYDDSEDESDFQNAAGVAAAGGLLGLSTCMSGPRTTLVLEEIIDHEGDGAGEHAWYMVRWKDAGSWMCSHRELEQRGYKAELNDYRIALLKSSIERELAMLAPPAPAPAPAPAPVLAGVTAATEPEQQEQEEQEEQQEQQEEQEEQEEEE